MNMPLYNCVCRREPNPPPGSMETEDACMRLHKRILSLLLSAALLLPALPPARAVERETGSVSATLRVDYPQSLEALRNRSVQAELFQGSRSLGTLDLTRQDESDLDGYPAAVTLRNQDGGDLGGGNWPGFLDLSVSGLPQGAYTLEFTGEGFVPFRQDVILEDCSQHITLGTSDATFTLGDVNGDGRITKADRELVADALGSESRRDLLQYDLNGDGTIDIYDLAYASRNLNAQGESQVRDTALLAPPVDADGLWEALNRTGVTVNGDPEALFSGAGQAVTFTPSSGNLSLTIPLREPQELAELRILAPEGPGAPEAGSVTVEYEDGSLEEIPFDRSLPDGVRAIGPLPGQTLVTIPLGRRTAVKEITITVTRSQDGKGFTVLESIQFLRDIVPENPVPPNSEIRNLTADPGDSRVSLRWQELPNVSGYRVDYCLRDGGTPRSLRVDVPRAEVTGLENLKAYVFTVTPVDGSWEGRTSEAVTAVPQPVKAPSAPDMVSVSPLDSALSVSWKASKSASYYEVWYRAGETGSFVQWGSRLTGTSTVITGLQNGTTYSIYITAGNSAGLSGPSRTALGTPQAPDYSRPEGIPTAGVLDWQNLERVWLAAPGNVSPASYPASRPFQPEFMADGDFSTHWTSHSYGDGNWWDNKQVLCDFKEPADISAVIWVPRLDGSYASNLRLYTVTVWREGDDLNGPGTLLAPDPLAGGSASDAKTWLPVRNNPASTRFAVLPIEPVTDVVRAAVTLEQVGYSAVSLSELMFLEYDPARCLPDNIADLFSDGLRTTLRPGVSQADVDALRARLNSDEGNYYLNPEILADELDLAEALLRGEGPGRVLRGLRSRSGAADSQRYGQSASDLQPLGAAARAGEDITIYAAGIPDGETVTVYATQFNAEASTWRASMGTLRNGRNVLAVPQIGSQDTPRGGSLYVTYSGSAPQDIQLHIRRAAEIPLLALDGWFDMSESGRRTEIGLYVDALTAYCTAQGINSANRTTHCLNVTELSLPSVLLSLPAAAVQSALGPNRAEAVETLYDNVLAWEDVMRICETTQGIDETGAGGMTSRQNIRCMQMFAGAFMYAAGSHIGIGYGSCGGMVCGKPLSALEPGAQINRLFGWGIAHEIGHNMDKLGQAEITNNLYSLMVQTADGGKNILPSRLEKENRWPSVFSKTAAGLPGESSNVFTQLGLYWQLHLAYDDGDMDFYSRFFKDWKTSAGSGSYGDRLALTASRTAGRNLTEFFQRWGVSLSEETRSALAAYPEEERAVWYLSDQSRRDRLAGKTPASGTVSLTAEKQGDREVLLTISSTAAPDQVQGYEILRNNEPIAFTVDGTFTDIIGSANHRTYTYAVRAYDTLGHCFAGDEAPELRIAYDKTVDPGAYTLTRDGGAVTLTLTEETPVSGLKLAQAPAGGTFSVSITDGAGNTASARQGDFSQDNQAADDADSYLTYFQKPGAPETDARIWTYDAKTVVITGIPEEIPDADIQLVSYAGDDVAFLEGGTAGILAQPYRYGEGANQELPAGTLVIAGTYRGNPLYQIVRIEGQFVKTEVDENGEFTTTEEIRPLDGKALLLAEIPEDGAVSDISDGLFLFVPNVQREAELQGEVSGCAAERLLPSRMRAVLSRTDLPTAPESQRVTAETLWIDSPGGSDLPVIELKEG